MGSLNLRGQRQHKDQQRQKKDKNRPKKDKKQKTDPKNQTRPKAKTALFRANKHLEKGMSRNATRDA